jgi:hypothetical protein
MPLLRLLLRNHTPIDAEGDAIGHNIGVDAALYEPDVDR